MKGQSLYITITTASHESLPHLIVVRVECLGWQLHEHLRQLASLAVPEVPHSTVQTLDVLGIAGIHWELGLLNQLGFGQTHVPLVQLPDLFIQYLQ